MKVKEILETMDYGNAPESGEQAMDWIKKHSGEMGLYINGAILVPDGREFFETRNPANGKLLAKICQASSEDIDAAVSAARQAQPDW